MGPDERAGASRNGRGALVAARGEDGPLDRRHATSRVLLWTDGRFFARGPKDLPVAEPVEEHGHDDHVEDG